MEEVKRAVYPWYRKIQFYFTQNIISLTPLTTWFTLQIIVVAIIALLQPQLSGMGATLLAVGGIGVWIIGGYWSWRLADYCKAKYKANQIAYKDGSYYTNKKG